jgi:endoglucanase
MNMNNKYRHLFMVLFVAGLLFPSFALAPKHGWLKTEGGNLLNEKGNIVQLRGMSFYWSNPTWNGIKYYNASTVNTMVNDWKCTVLRVAYDRDKCHDNGWSQCQTVIQAAIDAGIYVIIDWHSYDAENCQNAAVSFFTEQAKKYKSTPNVIFEPYNEPHGPGGTQEDAIKYWGQIKPYMTAVTQAIRDQGAPNLVILGTPYFSQFVNVASNDQPKDQSGKVFTNVAYVFHFYAASHGPNAHYLESGKSAMEAEYLKGGLGKVPVFVSEWGTTHSDGGANGHTYVDETNTEWWFTNYLDKYHLSHCNWSISDLEASSCFSGGTSLSQSGTIAQRHIKNAGTDEFPTASSLGNEGPASDSVFTMPGYHPARAFNRYFGGNINSTDFAVTYSDRDNVDVQNAGHTCVKIQPGANDDWVSYFLNSTSAAKKMAIRYLAKDGAGTVDVYLKNAKAGSFSIQKAAAWTTSVIDANAAAGKDTLKLKFSGVTGTGFWIEWFRLADTISPVKSPAGVKPAAHTPIAIVPVSMGFEALLPESHGFVSYRLVGVNGKAIGSGALSRTQTAMRFDRLSGGIWFLELTGEKGVKMLPVIVR